MNAFMRLLSTIVAWGDSSSNTNNPKLKFVDWSRDNSGLEVANPQSQPFRLSPGQELAVFDGTRALTIDGTTEMSLSLVSGETDRYRFRHTAGTDPTFRTERAVAFAPGAFTVTVNANGTAVFSYDAGGSSAFSAAQVGDVLWIPDTNEVPAQAFQAANQGFWTVLSATDDTITVTRLEDFEAAAETVTVPSTDCVRLFSASGVQEGDKLRVSAGFSTPAQRTYTVEAVTPDYLEVSSSAPLANEADTIPGAAGFSVYTFAKRLVHIEADQEATVRVNGDTGSFQLISPWVAGDLRSAGVYQRVGPTWSLSVVNRASVPMSLLVISAE